MIIYIGPSKTKLKLQTTNGTPRKGCLVVENMINKHIDLNEKSYRKHLIVVVVVIQLRRVYIA